VVASRLVSISEVNLHRAHLVLGWLIMSGFNFRCGTFILICNQPSRLTQPGHPFGGRHNEQRAVLPCSCRVKAVMVMVRVWVTGKTG